MADHLETSHDRPTHTKDENKHTRASGAQVSETTESKQPINKPMPRLSIVKNFREQARLRSASIHRSFGLLKSILERHEALIQKRWKKKTKEQRRKILLSAWKEPMAALHSPDFEATWRGWVQLGVEVVELRQTFLCPYINQEDLITPENLLLLMNARGRHDPTTFAAADLRAMEYGFRWKMLGPIIHEDGYMMLLTDWDGPEKYGQIVNSKDQTQALESVPSETKYRLGEGLTILEAQDRVLSFLVECAERILLDIPRDRMTQYPKTCEPPSVSKNKSGFASPAVMAAEAPYRAPMQVDFLHLESLLAAKRDEAIDHLWALRTDPGYFSHIMRESEAHRIEHILDANGNPNPFITSNRKHFEASLIKDEIWCAYTYCNTWSHLFKESKMLKEMQKKYNARVRPYDNLPADYRRSLLTFKIHLATTWSHLVKFTCKSMMGSPAWRSQQIAEYTGSLPFEVHTKVTMKPGLKLTYDEDKFRGLLELMDSGDVEYRSAATYIMLDELQHLLSPNRPSSVKLTAYSAKMVADLSIYIHCIHQIELYRPGLGNLETEDSLIDSGVVLDVLNATELHLEMFDMPRRSYDKFLFRYGGLDKLTFRYPVDKRKTKENIEAMRSAEADLDRFWRLTDDFMLQELGYHYFRFITDYLKDCPAASKTPKWVEPDSVSTNTIATEQHDLVKPLSEVYLDLQQRTERTLQLEETAKPPKAKSKTRVDSNADAATGSSPSSIEPEIPAAPPRFYVDSRALKVFKTLFFTQSQTAVPGEIPWKDFLHAMVSVGFQPEKVYGSVWQFNPIKADVERSIHFHEPHPSGKIPYLVARRHGRRLSKAYGWNGGTFVLAEKKG